MLKKFPKKQEIIMTELLSRIFIKNRDRVQDPRVRSAYGTLVSITGIVLNLILFVSKFLVGTLFGSSPTQ